MTAKVFDRSKLPDWAPFFYQHFLGFAPLAPFWAPKAHHCNRWPTVTDWQAWSLTVPDLTMRFAAFTPQRDYETHLYHYQEVLTRAENWHDFLYNMTWCVFPRIKTALFQRMQAAMQNHGQAHDPQPIHDPSQQPRRTPLQNVLAHFDECGMVICARETACFDWLRQGQWKRFFWETPDIPAMCEPIIVGHGLFEKALTPYVGLTGKALLLKVPSDFFALKMQDKLTFVDKQVSHIILQQDFISHPKCLQPFPVLGWPHWDPNNRQESYYDNQQYFRAQLDRDVPILSYR